MHASSSLSTTSKKTKKLLDSGTENMASLGMIFGKNKEKFNYKSLHHLL
jgi:ABC-type enterochelin transport system substrate-binding protein